MDNRMIGNAHCQATLIFRAEPLGTQLLAGVVRVGGENKIIVLQLSGVRKGQLVLPHNRPGELDQNPIFNSWPMASLEEAQKLMSGEIPTNKQVSLGVAMRPYARMGG